MDPQFIVDRVDEIKANTNERIDRLEDNIKQHLDMCQQLCVSRIARVEDETKTAHRRLNDHKTAIECLSAHKNRELGFRKAIYFGMTVMTILIAILAVWVSIRNP